MKAIIVILLIFLALLQHRLWFGKNSVPDYVALESDVTRQRTDNDKLIERNKILYADTDDLKLGVEGIEERARNELGMIKENEVFFRIVSTQHNKTEPNELNKQDAQ